MANISVTLLGLVTYEIMIVEKGGGGFIASTNFEKMYYLPKKRIFCYLAPLNLGPESGPGR